MRTPAVSRSKVLLAVVLALGVAGGGMYMARAQVEPADAEHYDVLIRGGRLLDGTGAPWRYADVAIRGDRIVEVGVVAADATAALEIDATGRYVTPGFIDPHSHSGDGLVEERTAAAAPLLYQGITTALINPDGGGPADLGPQLERIRELVPGVNVIPTIGNNGVRLEVMQYEGRAPTPAELERMKELVRSAMELGAFGLNSGLWASPGPFTTPEELIALAKVAAEFPDAFYISHIRDEGDYNVGLLGAVEEVIQVSREAGLPGIVTHIKAYGPSVRGRAGEVIALIDAARAEGIEVWADQYPYNFAGGGMANDLLPTWVVAGGIEPRVERLSDAAQLPRIREEMRVNLARAGGAENIVIRNFSPDESLVGKRLAEIAQARSEDPIETVIHMMKRGDAGMMQFNMHEPDVEAFMRQPWTMTSTDGTNPAFREGGAHPRSYGAFARKLRKYALDGQVITLEKAVHSSSGLPAAVLGVRDRGVVRPGAYADLLVIDPERVRDVATYQEPHAYSEGFDYVFVNGRAAIADGALVNGRYGRVLLRHEP